jgi:hypothetical protein
MLRVKCGCTNRAACTARTCFAAPELGDGNDHALEFELTSVQQAIGRQEMQYMVTKTNNTAFFGSDDNRVLVGQLAIKIYPRPFRPEQDQILQLHW